MIWQLRASAGRKGIALRLISISFSVLAIYVAARASLDIWLGQQPDASPIGIALKVIALLVMVPIAMLQGRTGRSLGSEVVVAQASETWLSNALSLSLLLGLGLNALLGVWWADPATALLGAGVAVCRGRR